MATKPNEPMPTSVTDCKGCNLIRNWALTAWNRGHAMGLAANESAVKQAVAALDRERASHLDTNRMMTEALMHAESQIVQPATDTSNESTHAENVSKNEAEIDMLRLDAARYRWLRDKALEYDQIGGFSPYPVRIIKGQILTPVDGAELDAAIDAEMLGGGAS